MADKSLSTALKVRIEKGDFLFREGDTSKDLYVIQFGKVRIYKTEAGVDIDLAEVGPGGVVGEVAAIDGGTRSASGVAMETTEVLVVAVDDFKKILEKIPDWFRKIATILVQRLREIDEKIHRTMGGDNLQQVAMLIALMAHSPLAKSGPEGYEIAQKDLENELVDVLQLQLSDITQSLSKLNKQELVGIRKGKIIIKNIRKLEEVGNAVFSTAEETPAT